MTEHKTLNTVVHAAFRRNLQRFDDALAAFPAGSTERAADLKRAWDFLEEELQHHHHYEETLFWPALQEVGSVELALMGALDGEHDAMRDALGEASMSMGLFAANPNADNTVAARQAIAHLSDVLLSHLAHEERDLEPLAAQFKDTELMKTARNSAKKAHRGKMGSFIAWLEDGADDDARRGLRREIPPPVVFVINSIGGRQYRREIAAVWN